MSTVLPAPPRRLITGSLSLRPPVEQPPSLVEVGVRRALVTTGVMLAALLQMIDVTIVNVSLPTIQGNLGATVDQATWILTAYVVANVIMIPITPWMQRRFGRKRFFLISIIGFTVGSMLCGFATSLVALVAFRVLQGAFGGGLLSTAQIILRDTFGPKELGQSQSIFAFGTVIGPSLGPTLGGIITDNLSWPWVFEVNVVPGAVAAILIWRYLRDNAERTREQADVVGLALLTITVASLQFTLDQGQQYDWFSDGRILTAATLALLGLAAFIAWELHTPAPIVDLRVLRHRVVAIATLTLVANATGIFGGALMLPQFTVSGLGFTSTQAGMLLAMRALPVLLLTLPIGRLINTSRLDLRVLIGGGLFLHGLGVIWLSQRISSQAEFLSFVVPQLLAGFGIAFIYSPVLVATLRAVPRDGAKASAFIILSFQLGGSIASATIVTLFDRREALHQALLASAARLDRPAITQFLQTHTTAQLSQLVGTQATVMAYSDALLVAGILVAGFAPFVYFLKAGKHV